MNRRAWASCVLSAVMGLSICGVGHSAGKPRLRLVFCPLHYQDTSEFRADATGLIEILLRTHPFDEVPETIVWRILEAVPNEDVVFTPAVGTPPLAIKMEWIDALDVSQPGLYKLVIVDAEGAVSCAELSSVEKRSVIIVGKRRYGDSGSFAKGFLHELGHALGLRDECVRCASTDTAGPPNCATTHQEAEAWWGDLVEPGGRVEYVNGCVGTSAYLRPTIASFMNDPDKAGDYGPVNERYLRAVLQRTTVPPGSSP